MANIFLLTKNLFLEKPPKVIAGKIFERITRKKISFQKILQQECNNKTGIETGGPSGIFEWDGYCPVYPYVKQIDCVNFSDSTVWEGKISEGLHFRYGAGKTGYQWITEATDLGRIKNDSYGFLISSNCLEHIANPLKAVKEWCRVVKADGFLLIAVPRKESNFDHKRPVTTFGHLVDDYNTNTGEDDLTHVPEILRLHNLKRDILAGNFENFKQRSKDNLIYRCLHHHVFDLNLLEEIAAHFNLEVLFKETSVMNHHIMLRKK